MEGYRDKEREAGGREESRREERRERGQAERDRLSFGSYNEETTDGKF